MAEQQPSGSFEEHEEHQAMLELQQSCFALLSHTEELLKHAQRLTSDDEKYGFLDEYSIPEGEHPHGDYEWEFSLSLNPFDDEVFPELSFARSTDNPSSELWQEITSYGSLLDERLREVEITMVSRATNILFNAVDNELRVYETDCVSYIGKEGEHTYLFLAVDERPDELDHKGNLGVSAEEVEREVDHLYSYNQLTQSASLLLLATEAISTIFDDQQVQVMLDTQVKQAEERFNSQLLDSNEVEMLWEAGEQVVAERPEAIRRYSVSWDNSVELVLSDLADDATAVEIEYSRVPSESRRAIRIKLSYLDGKTYRYKLTPSELTDLDATTVPVMRAEGDKLLDALVGLVSVRSD